MKNSLNSSAQQPMIVKYVEALHILDLSIWHSPVFLLNSCLDRFSAPSHKRVGTLYPEVTGVSLPSSLTVNHSSALEYSSRLRVSVCAFITGMNTNAAEMTSVRIIGPSIRLAVVSTM